MRDVEVEEWHPPLQEWTLYRLLVKRQLQTVAEWQRRISAGQERYDVSMQVLQRARDRIYRTRLWLAVNRASQD
jgi:hypothetical protein